MKNIFTNKLARLFSLALIFFVISAFCFEAVLAAPQAEMPIEAHDYRGADFPLPMTDNSKNMMPCCGDSEHHEVAVDISASKNFMRQLVALGSVVKSAELTVRKNIFSNTSYELPAPPGPDILLSVVKKE
jgi:hypothetical protein